MTAATRIMIALVVALLMVAALVVFGVTHSVLEEPEPIQEAKAPELSEEVQEACEKAKLDLINGTAKGELDKDQRAALEGVITRQCE